MKPKVWIPLVVLLLLLIGGTVTWAMWPREAPEVQQVKELASKMFDEETTDEQRREMRDQMRELRDNVPEERRREVFQAMGNQFRQRMTAHMREFAELPESERNEFLDRDIDRMERMRREFEQARAERGDDAGARGGERGPRVEGGRGPGEGGRRGRGNMTEEQREQRRRARLDNTTPEDRAYFTEYIKAINERREERGLEPMRRGPFGRGPR